jgi:hypothetical protein
VQTKTREISESSEHRAERELSSLKSLLLKDERESLQDVLAQIRALQDRVGDDQALQTSVARVISESLSASNKEDPTTLNRVLSPMVVSSMQRHIKHSSDEVVEVMYPITGRMVASTVKNAIAELTESINNQFETTYSPRGMVASVRAKMSGRPISDFLVARSLSAQIVRAIVLEKDSGKIVTVWHPEDKPVEDEDNLLLVSGLLAALNNLAEEAFDRSGGGFRSLDLDGRQIVMRRSVKHMLVLELTGVLSTNEQKMVDTAFVHATEKIDSAGPSAAIDELSTLQSHFSTNQSAASESPNAKRSRLAWTAGTVAIALLVLAWPATRFVQNWQLQGAVAQIEQAISQDKRLIGFPIQVKGNRSTGNITVSGLLPAKVNATQLYATWRRASNGRDLNLSFSRVLTQPI